MAYNLAASIILTCAIILAYSRTHPRSLLLTVVHGEDDVAFQQHLLLLHCANAIDDIKRDH